MILFSLSISVIIALTPKVSDSFVCCPEHATKVNAQMNMHNAIIIFFIISSSKFRFFVLCDFPINGNFSLLHFRCNKQHYYHKKIYTIQQPRNSIIPWKTLFWMIQCKHYKYYSYNQHYQTNNP